MNNIGIIGHGFVGKAVDYGFSSNWANKTIIDPIYKNHIEDLGPEVNLVFVCVPTPMGKDGHIDATIVWDTVRYLLEETSAIVVLKSTVTPDIIQNICFNIEGGMTRFVYNPEFLTEKRAMEDFVNPIMHVIGCYDRTTAEEVKQWYDDLSICKPCPVYYMLPHEASYVKYGVNCFLATKVLFFNQLHDTVTEHGGNFGAIINAIGTDPRIGDSHTRVPGFDGKQGFGGACFPKDTNAFINFAKTDPDPRGGHITKDNHQTMTVLEEAISANNKYRKGYEMDARELEQNVSYD
tara:strand:+ start:3586 stop:4464 length:879 start_codon:yes stop_codon:yes gene_type:complete